MSGVENRGEIRQQEELFHQYDRESKRISEQIYNKKQKQNKFDLFERQVDDLQIRVEARLELLSQTWKGREAEVYLSESLAMHQKYRRDSLRRIYTEKQVLQKEMRQLENRQGELSHLKREAVSQRRRR
jgi:hypothetical protein